MGNSRSKLGHEKLADEGDDRYFRKVERRNRVKTKDMSIPLNDKGKRKISKRGARSSTGDTHLTNSSTRNGGNAADPSTGHGAFDETNVHDEFMALTSVRNRSDMFRQAEEQQQHGRTIVNNNGSGGLGNGTLSFGSPLQQQFSKKSQLSLVSTFTPSPDKTPQIHVNRAPGSASSIARIVSPQPLPSPRGSSHRSNGAAAMHMEARRRKKAEEENKKFEEEMIADGMIEKEITRSGKVTALAWIPISDLGRILAIGTDDGFVAVMDVGDRDDTESWGFEKPPSLMRREFPREGKVRSLSWSSDGNQLAIGGDDCIAAIVDTKTMKIIHEIEREDRIYGVDYSQDIEFLAIGGFDGLVTVVSADSYDLLVEIPMQGLVLSLSWSPDSSILAVSGSDKTISFFDSDGWDHVSEFNRESAADCLCWSPSGSLIAVGDHDGTVSFIDLESRNVAREIKKERKKVNTICWSKDGFFLCVGSTENLVSIYETKSCEVVHEMRRSDQTLCSDWNWQDNGYLAVGSGRKVAILKSSLSSKAHNNLKQSKNKNHSSLPITSDNNTMDTFQLGSEEVSEPIFSMGRQESSAAFTTEWSQQRGDFEKSEESVTDVLPRVTESDEQTMAKTSINAVAISNDVYYMATGGSDGSVLIYGTDTWDVVADIDFTNSIRFLRWTKAGEYLIVGLEGKDALVITQMGDPQFEILNELPISSPAHCLGWSLADQMLAVGSPNGSITFIDSSPYPATHWNVVKVHSNSNDPIHSLDWSRNGRYLAVGGGNCSCVIFDAKLLLNDLSIRQIANIQRKSVVHSVSFGAGGSFLAVGGADCKITVYRAKGKWAVCQEVAMTSWILDCSWSFDGRFLAVGCAETNGPTYSIVDTISWESTNVSEDHFEDTLDLKSEASSSLDFSSDGKWLVVGGDIGNARVIDVEAMEVAFLIERGGSSYESDQEEGEIIGYQEEQLPLSNLQNEVMSAPYDQMSDIHESNISVANTSDANSILEDLASATSPKQVGRRSQTPKKQVVIVRWTQREEPDVFLEIVDEFLRSYEFDDPPQILRVFVASCLSLQYHVRWLNSHAMIVDVLSLQEDGQPLETMCRTLQRTSELMEEVMGNSNRIYEWWGATPKLDLSQGDKKRIASWNLWWEQVDVNASLVKLDMLLRIDEESNARREEDREENYVYDQSEHVTLPTKGRRFDSSENYNNRSNPEWPIQSKRSPVQW